MVTCQKREKTDRESEWGRKSKVKRDADMSHRRREEGEVIEIFFSFLKILLMLKVYQFHVLLVSRLLSKTGRHFQRFHTINRQHDVQDI